ncbi:amidohydrolase [Acidaminobacter sp. JC074]|uniref:M20 metallopeptidase family protein n=1 Tax=Acidaminobacter sp. JC074 TaxID=2530199 RepID=UPI001F0F30FB|nr:M20 family metallopeptidase [Acidaminobacter sp. JC074]MCH4891272.1 amidohydrolase [Acidaminobacter sp. JC074]
MGLNQTVQAYLNQAIQLRRDLHRIPEIGYSEMKTSEYICKFLDENGISYEKNIAKTGIIAKIEGNKIENGKTIAFRADMDALSLSEQNDIEFKSTHQGRMHGCGHDGHMTMLLLLAKHLMAHKNELNSDVVLIFQPAEEGPGGAKPMIDTGFLDKYQIDEVFGIHLHPDFNTGVIAVNKGPVMAMTGEFDFDIYTKSGHGAMPHTANDATIVMSQMISQFQSIVSRNVNPTEAGVVTVGRIEAGERRNIIAEHVRLEGTTRAFSEEVYNLIQTRMLEVAKGLELSFNCKIESEIRTMYPPVVNHASSVDAIREACKDMEVVDFPPQMIAEDFSFFLKERKGAFIFLGIRDEDNGFDKPLHNSKFNFDEEALLYGLQCYINLLNLYGSNI